MIFSMLALLSVAFAFTSCSDDDSSEPSTTPSDYSYSGDGSKKKPYTATDARNFVKNLTWTDKDTYDKSGNVYVKGKISRIDNYGTFAENVPNGYASFYISEDGTQNNEFFCFRVLYFGNKVYKMGQTDIKVGDNVVIYGKLMNYRNSTPETVAGAAYLISLNGATDGGYVEDTSSYSGDGSKQKPFSATDALDFVKNLTWTDTDTYDKTGDVYVKGKISRIVSNGTFTGGGTYGNATFYISDDGTDLIEFHCFRILYFEGKKYKSGQTDIKVGDEVIVYGKLMNYKGNTPQTVPDEAYLISLNGATDGGAGYEGGYSVSFATNAGAQRWSAATDGTYGEGFSCTAEGLNIGFYKHTCSMNLPTPNDNHVRIYKNSVLSIAATGGKKIKEIVINCAPNAGTASYCFDMAGLEGGASAVADKSALTITWKGSASKVVLHANNGQVRMEGLTVVFE